MHRFLLSCCACTVVAAAAFGQSGTLTSPVVVLPTGGHNIWRLAAGHLKAGDSSTQIVGTTYDGRVCAFDLDGNRLMTLWDAPVGSFSFAVTTVPVDKTHGDDVLVGTAGGLLLAFDSSGKQLWKVDFHVPVYAVAAVTNATGAWIVAGTVDGTLAVFDLEGHQKNKIALSGAIRTLVPGDYLGNGQQQLFVSQFPRDDSGTGQVMKVPELTGIWSAFEPVGIGVVEHGMNAVAADLFGTGKEELISQEHILEPYLGSGSVTDLANLGTKTYYAGGYRMAIPAAGHFLTKDGSANIAMVRGEEVGLFSIKPPTPDSAVAAAAPMKPGSGQEDSDDSQETNSSAPPQAQSLQQQQTRRRRNRNNNSEDSDDNASTTGRRHKNRQKTGPAVRSAIVASPVLSAESKLSFSDILTLPGKHGDRFLLGSAPNGDDNLYLVTPDPANAWVQAIAHLTWHGRIQKVDNNVMALGNAVDAWHGKPAIGQSGPYIVVVEDRPKFGFDASIAAGLKQMIDTNAYYRKRFPYPDRIKFTQEFEIQEQGGGVPQREAGKTPNALTQDQCVEIARRLEAAGIPWIMRAAHGAVIMVSAATAEAMVEAAPKTAVGFSTAEQGPGAQLLSVLQKTAPLMDVAQRHKLYFYFNEKNTFWASAASQPSIQQFLFAPKYLGTVVPSAEDSNSRAPDISMFARLGLYTSGRSTSWGSRLVADAFSFNRLWDWERVMVGNPQLRSLVAQTELGASHFVINTLQRSESGQPNLVMNAGVAQFLDLLGKGVIAPPKVDQMGNLSPIALAIENPTRRFLLSGTGGHDFRPNAAQPDYVFGRLSPSWGMAPTGATDLAHIAWGRDRQFGSYIPDIGASGDGLLLPFPGGPAQAGPFWKQTFITDGDTIAGSANEPDGVARVKAAMDRASAQLPVRVTGDVFYQCSRQSVSEYHLVLVDHGYLDPSDRKVTITNQLQGEWKLSDRISGKQLGKLARGQSSSVTVPAGSLRVLSLESML